MTTNSSICVDANIIVWSLVPSPLSAAAGSLLAELRAQKRQLIAPYLLSYEVTSTFRRLTYLREITAEEGEDAFSSFKEIQVRYYHSPSLIDLAWQLARQANRPRAYDMAYVAVALAIGCDLWTADERLFNGVNHLFPFVKWLGNHKIN